MSKMREFKIISGTEEKVIESTSFKKALKSYQRDSKAKMVTISWKTKKGKSFVKEQKLPIGRKKKLR